LWQDKHSKSGISHLGSLFFFGLALVWGNTAIRVIWQRHGGPFFGSFGFVFNFGLFKLTEPWSSWFVLFCCANFLWAGFSIAQTGNKRVGILVGSICLLIFLSGFISAAF